MEVLDQDVVGPVSQLEVVERLPLFGVVRAHHEHPRLARGEHVVRDRLAQLGREARQFDGGLVDVHRARAFHALAGDGRAKPVGHEGLLDLDLGAIGERGGLFDADALLAGPVGHFLGLGQVVEKALHVAVDDGFEAHHHRLFVQRGDAARLIALGLGEQALVGEPGAGRDVELGVHRDHRLAGAQGLVDDLGGVQHVSAALDDDVGGVDQLLHRLGQALGEGKTPSLVQRAARLHRGQVQVGRVVVDEAREATGDEASADQADAVFLDSVHVGVELLCDGSRKGPAVLRPGLVGQSARGPGGQLQ